MINYYGNQSWTTRKNDWYPMTTASSTQAIVGSWTTTGTSTMSYTIDNWLPESTWEYAAKNPLILHGANGQSIEIPLGSIASHTVGGYSHYEVYVEADIVLEDNGNIRIHPRAEQRREPRRIMLALGRTPVYLVDADFKEVQIPLSSVNVEYETNDGRNSGRKITIQLPPGVTADGVSPREAPKKEFNPFINASDMLEQFIEFLGTQDVKQTEVLGMPIELFIQWLILQACTADQVELPKELIAAIPREWLPPQPRCSYCQRWMRKYETVKIHADCQRRKEQKEREAQYTPRQVNTSVGTITLTSSPTPARRTVPVSRRAQRKSPTFDYSRTKSLAAQNVISKQSSTSAKEFTKLAKEINKLSKNFNNIGI